MFCRANRQKSLMKMANPMLHRNCQTNMLISIHFFQLLDARAHKILKESACPLDPLGCNSENFWLVWSGRQVILQALVGV